MILLILAATPLFTYGTALIEAGDQERGEASLEAFLSTSMTQEMHNRTLYNLAVSSLEKSSWNSALSFFQQIEGGSADLKPFVQEGIEMALKQKPQPPLPPLPPLPLPLSLEGAKNQVRLISKHLTSLPFERGEATPEYENLKSRLDLLLLKKKEWWGTVIAKQEELSDKGCFQQQWESVVQRLGEGTELLEKAANGFAHHAKPYATLYPLLKEAYSRLQLVENEMAKEKTGYEQHPDRTEHFQTLSEMYRKDLNPPKPIPQGALW